MEDEPASDGRVIDRRIRFGGVEQDAGGADGAGGQDDLVRVDRHWHIRFDAEIRWIDDRVPVLGPRCRHVQPQPGCAQAGVVEQHLVDDRVCDETERILAIGNSRVDQLATGIELVIDRRWRIADREAVQVIERGIDAECGRSLPECSVVVVEFAFRERARADRGSHPVIGVGERLGGIGGGHQPLFDPAVDASLDRRFERRKGEVDIDRRSSAERFAAANDDGVVGGGGEIILIHQPRVAARVHRTPDHERPFFDQHHALAVCVQLIGDCGATRSAADDQIVDRTIGVRDRLCRRVVHEPARRDIGSVQPGVEIGMTDENGRSEERRQRFGQRQIPDPGEIGFPYDGRHLGRYRSGRSFEKEGEEGSAEVRIHRPEPARRRDERLHGGIGRFSELFVEGQGGRLR